MKNLNILAVMAFVAVCAAPVMANPTVMPATPEAAAPAAEKPHKMARAEKKAKAEKAKPIAAAYKADMTAAGGDKAKEKAAWNKASEELKKEGIVGKKARKKTIEKVLNAQ